MIYNKYLFGSDKSQRIRKVAKRKEFEDAERLILRVLLLNKRNCWATRKTIRRNVDKQDRPRTYYISEIDFYTGLNNLYQIGILEKEKRQHKRSKMKRRFRINPSLSCLDQLKFVVETKDYQLNVWFRRFNKMFFLSKYIKFSWGKGYDIYDYS